MLCGLEPIGCDQLVGVCHIFSVHCHWVAYPEEGLSKYQENFQMEKIIKHRCE